MKPANMTPIKADGRTLRTVQRRQYKKTMKSLVSIYKTMAESAYGRGKRDVAEAAHHLTYDEA